ncbi:CPBP family intramembrane glutamic endopeptidase [Lentilactobacillus farraginis]|uniref:Abortive infection protein n=1 Tax=Lentilactobacillus farraginis DSM 18382 = JCM 14108 TaxID=1423743 RepID=X0PMC5_9LACO|nr:CPBP family intramembrane glutamic endopeptidase [Lentilactobacillus farraginis]KRM13616.1 abortive infection protein [Lentilactobacillus farraginis DSM 18382 = JCM 14108]GAF37961.1 hypothetical protein JCM14108_3052 [Lentilactobacillus farraginis DSM 18382 = JCM 14108]
MKKLALMKTSNLKKLASLLIAFILIEKIIENVMLAPLLTKSPLSEITSNIVYEGIKIALVLGLNYFLTRQMIHLKFKITIKQVVFFMLSLGYLALVIKSGSPKYFLETFVWVALAAVSEELLFRGVILGNLIDLMIQWTTPNRLKIWGTVILASLVFSLEHLTNLMNQTLPVTICQLIQTFGMGVLLAAVYIRTGSLVDAIYLHFLIDFPALYISQFTTLRSGTASQTSPQVSLTGSIVIAVIYLLIAIALTKSFGQQNRLVSLKRQILNHK